MTSVCQKDVVDFEYKIKKEVNYENKSLLQNSSKGSAGILFGCG